MASKFVKGDKVIVISGADKGKTGEITKIIRKNGIVEKVVVSGVKMTTVHKKPTSNTPGQIIKVEKPIHVSNVAHIESGKAVKIGFELDNNGKKIRVSRKTKKKIG
ncbi:50S ribosomal protein L24 [Pseudomonadota bacterium]